MNEVAEAALLEAFSRQRDETAFRALYRMHTPMLYAMAMRLSGSGSDADELVQEAWVRAVERHDRFAGRSRYRTWLVGILINCHRESAKRRRRRLLSLIDDGHPESVESASPAAPAPADAIDVDRALADLPDGYREVVILHDLNGYTHREIAAMLDIQEGTSKSQLNRGRARLRQLLAKRPADPHSRGVS